MKKLLATLSLAATLAASATPHAQGAFDFSGLDVQAEVQLGTVRSVDIVQVERDIHAFDERAFELRMQPDLTERLVIRLDEGDVVIVTVKGAQRFEAGERVRVVSQTYSPYGPRVEHERGR
jgi:outer membrane lipoprotein SlyB